MRRATAVTAAALLAVAACSGTTSQTSPLPQDKLSYAGLWQADGFTLRIAVDGQVDYHRRTGLADKSLKAPIKGFDGDNFRMGVGPITTTFVVSVPPHRSEGGWKMTVDGVELRRNDSGEI